MKTVANGKKWLKELDQEGRPLEPNMITFILFLIENNWQRKPFYF